MWEGERQRGRCMSVYIHAEARGGLRVPSSIALYHIFWARVKPVISVRLASKPWICLSTLQWWGYRHTPVPSFCTGLMWTWPLLLYINCLYSLSYFNSWVMLNWKIKDSTVWQRHFQDITASWQWQDYSSLLSSRSTVKEQKWRRKIRKMWSFRREVCKSEVSDKKSTKDKSSVITRDLTACSSLDSRKAVLRARPAHQDSYLWTCKFTWKERA